MLINSRVEDEILSATLLASIKDRAEHVMLVDLARNDVNRVCRPETVKVDSLMQVEKFSHVMHLTSQVSGLLREGLTRYVLLPFFLAFRRRKGVWGEKEEELID